MTYITKNELVNIHSLLPIQKGILFHTLKNKEDKPSTYIVQTQLKLRGEIDVDNFWLACKYVINKYDILKASLCLSYQDFKFYIHRNINLPNKFLNISSVNELEQKKIISTFLSQDQDTPFDLEQPPLMRFTLFKLSDNDYYLIWTIHHLLIGMADSGIKVINEIFDTYESIISNHILEKEYIDTSYSIALKKCLSLTLSSKAKTYWKNIFSDFSGITAFSTFTHEINTSESQKNLNFNISKNLYALLKKFAAEQHITINTLIQGAWGLLLSRYTDNEDVVFGMVRSYPKQSINNAIGLFINTLPIRVLVNPHLQIMNYLKNIREQQIAIREYINTPLYKIYDWCGLDVDRKLFDTIVDFKPNIFKKSKNLIKRLGNKEDIFYTVNTNYSLVLEVIEEEDYLSAHLHYATKLFQENHVRQISRHFLLLLKIISNNPYCLISNINMVTKKEKERFFINYNNTVQTYPIEKTIHQLFEQQVNKSPYKVALIGGQKRVTYSSLNKKANVIAHYLLEKGIKPEARIALCGERSVEMIIAMLGILKSGACYVTVDLSLPASRIRHILKDSAVSTLLLKKVDCSTLNNILLTDSIFNELNIFEIETILKTKKINCNPNILTASDSLAYVIYTSGSTGMPKGIMIEHKSVVNMALSHIKKLNIMSHMRILQYVNLNFDVFVAEWSTALLSGAQLCIVPSGKHFVGSELATFIRNNKINVAFLPSAILQSLPLVKLSDLEILVFGGDFCDQATLEYWKKNRLLIN
ncbi:MAG TPA: condensation domain-containing protein, partial [Gammaproteobacteria bacterium]|nr:condensation domain-containing protein [Gammaproteobacteria bacterium]